MRTKRVAKKIIYEYTPLPEIVLEKEEDARSLIHKMEILIKAYGCATVSDFLIFVEIPATFVDDKIGWTSLEGFKISETSEGFYQVATTEPVAL